MEDISLRIQELKKNTDTVVLAHTYQPAEVQDAADYVGDSYGLSVQATETPASRIVFCGVRFMAETAAILNPAKEVVLPVPGAGCPMADMIEAADVAELKDKHPGHLVICYVNSTAEVKALSDICCTSSNALTIVRKIPPEQGIIFIPDRHLGTWIEEQTGRAMVLWNGFCTTHVRITPAMLVSAKAEHPDAVVMIHPEAPKQSRDLADQVLSTGGMCEFASRSSATEFVVATEIGILHTLRKRAPGKTFHSLPAREIVCPNMKKGSLESTLAALEGTGGEVITVPGDVADRARRSLERMLEMGR